MNPTTLTKRMICRGVDDKDFSQILSYERNNNVVGENRHNNEEKEGQSADESKNNRDDKRCHNIYWTCVRKMMMRWRLSDVSSKVALIASILLFVLIVSIHLWDKLFFQIGVLGEHNPWSTPSSFAVVINTFRRPERLQETVRHYAETCGKRYNVGQIFVIWADPETDPPPSGEFFFDDNESFFSLRGIFSEPVIDNRVGVEILPKTKDSLNSRFEPIPQLRTTSIFMVDDDIRVACSSLKMAFQAWKNYPESLVGYYPRLAADLGTFYATSVKPKDQQQLVYHAWPKIFWRQKFNIILTKACFLHSKYLELYTNDDTFPKEIKDHIDQQRNCEDIAMSMLVANYTKHSNFNKIEKDNDHSKAKINSGNTISARPIYVEGRVSDVGLFGGISSGTGHFSTRSDCLTQLTDIFRSKGWGSPLDDQFDLVPNSWVRHIPGFWWQYGPSNFFEWFCFFNFFS